MQISGPRTAADHDWCSSRADDEIRTRDPHLGKRLWSPSVQSVYCGAVPHSPQNRPGNPSVPSSSYTGLPSHARYVPVSLPRGRPRGRYGPSWRWTGSRSAACRPRLRVLDQPRQRGAPTSPTSDACRHSPSSRSQTASCPSVGPTRPGSSPRRRGADTPRSRNAVIRASSSTTSRTRPASGRGIDFQFVRSVILISCQSVFCHTSLQCSLCSVHLAALIPPCLGEHRQEHDHTPGAIKSVIRVGRPER